MKAFTVITIIALILLVGGGVTAGLIAASEQAPSGPPPQATVSLAEPLQTAPVETARPVQSSVAVQKSGADTLGSDQGRGLTAKPAVSGDVDGQFIIPEKTELKYPNLSSTLDQEPGPVERSAEQARSKEDGDDQGTVYNLAGRR